ncbi:MAG: GxxExxY protein [Muribaculaceae bacterium]|nr:GxxExxY protein [Muribaculaceae bacterium]
MMTIADINHRCQWFYMITGVAMQVHVEYHPGLLESAYEAAMVYLLSQQNVKVEEQVNLPIYWKDVKLNKHYCMDLVVGGDTIIELKAVKYINNDHRKQLWNYMHLTHMAFGLLYNFGCGSLFSEWYYRRDDGKIIKLNWRDNHLINELECLI